MRRSLLLLATAALAACALSGCSDETTVGPKMAAADTSSKIPILVDPIVKFPRIDPNAFVDITAGSGFTCARKANGYIYCWGRNTYYQSAGGNPNPVLRPTLVRKPDGSPLIAMQVDAGGYHACALEPNGLAWCWGYGQNGQVGIGGGQIGYFMPTPVAGGIAYTSISAGALTTCATSNQGFFCWGANVGGGNLAPKLISSFNRYVNVTVGELHACAMDSLDPNRTVDCFGGNYMGQAGVGPTLQTQLPFTLRAQFAPPVARVTTAEYFTCADLMAGTVQCVGANSWGQLGNGNTAQTFGVPTNVAGQLHGVTTGSNHACALTTANLAVCWGYGYDGQVGVLPYTHYTTPVAVRGNFTYRAIAAGYQHTCGIGTDNRIYCWGYNDAGQLGRGWASNYSQAPDATLDPVN